MQSITALKHNAQKSTGCRKSLMKGLNFINTSTSSRTEIKMAIESQFLRIA